MSGIPGSSYSMLAVYLVLTGLACFLLGGILPMVVLLAGLAMTIRNSDLRHLLNSGRFIAWFYGVVAMVSLLAAASHIAALSHSGLLSLTAVEHQHFVSLFGMAAALSGIGWAMTKYGLLPAFQLHARTVAAHGFWSRRAVDAPRNHLAAELAKWSEMGRGDHIDDEAFEAEQARLARAAA